MWIKYHRPKVQLNLTVPACIYILSARFYIIPYVNAFCISLCPHLIISSTVNNGVWSVRSICACRLKVWVCVFGRLVIEVTFDIPLLSVKTDKALQSNLSSASFSEMLLHASFSFPYPINIPHFKQTAAVPCSSAFAHFYANFCLFCTLFCHKFHTLKGFLHRC